MNVIVQSKTMRITRAMRAFVVKQATKIIKIATQVAKVRVYLEKVKRKDNDPHGISISYKVELPGKDIFIRKRTHDLYQGVVAATGTVIRRIRKVKEKKISLKRLRKHR